MTCYHHWFEEFAKSKNVSVHFFQLKVHFCIYLIVWIVGSSQILLDCVWPFKLRVLKKMRVLASQRTTIFESLTRLFITFDQVIGLRLDPHYGNRAESPFTMS